MAGNSKGGKGYRRQNYNETAYDQLGPRVRRALQEAVVAWDADWCLRMVLKYGADYVIKKIREGDKVEASRGFQMKAFEKKCRTSFSDPECRVSILRANWS